jgi:serine/threonine-protein kinase
MPGDACDNEALLKRACNAPEEAVCPCPAERQLQDLLAGRLSPAQEQGVLAHVEVCGACQQALEELTAGYAATRPRMAAGRDDSFWRRLKALVPDWPSPVLPKSPGPLAAGGDSGPEGGAGGSAGGEGPPGQPLPLIPGYTVVRELGRGGMAVVLLAEQLRLKRPVALKVPRASLEALDWLRFCTEGQAAARLQHPNIVQIHETGEHEGVPFLIMEYVEGGNLAYHLADAPLEARRAAELLVKLAQATHYAHSRGVIHRDLKPANVLLAGDGTPKITDFGLARRLGDTRSPDAVPRAAQTQTGVVLGTPSYMAPEQAKGLAKDVGPAADVYSLGAVLYECLTGRPPFKAPTVLGTLHDVVHEEPVPPRQLLRGLPGDLETVCLKCLRKEPWRRYPTAQELGDDLARFLDGKPVKARRVGTLERVVRWARRRPGTAVLLAVVLLLGALAAGAGLWLYRQEAARREEQAQRQRPARQAVEAALEQAPQLWRQGRWREARALLVQAESALADASSTEREQRLAQARADLELVHQLEGIRLNRTSTARGYVQTQPDPPAPLERVLLRPQRPIRVDFHLGPAAQQYAAAFQAAGLEVAGNEEDTAARLRRSAIREELVAALEDWAHATASTQVRDRLLRLAQRADPGSEWRARLRNPALWRNRSALRRLARETPLANLPAQAVLLLAQLQMEANLDPEPLLRAALQRRPDNFWFNYSLGIVLAVKMKSLEAAAYLRTAAVMRPSSAAYSELGLCLQAGQHWSEAASAYRQAIDLDDTNRPAHLALGLALRFSGQREDAIASHRRAIELAPHDPMAHYQLGYDLRVLGRTAEEVVAFARAAELAPRLARNRYEYGVALLSAGRTEEAIVELEQATKCDPGLSMAWEQLAAALLQRGGFALARAATQKCLGLPPGGAPRRKAQRRQIALCDRLLDREARLGDVLEGKGRPVNAALQRDLAELCGKYKRRHAAAARLYAAAFAARPKLAEDPATQDRYHAACAAALAGCGQGEDAAGLGADERSRLRGQALSWLEAERDTWARRIAGKSWTSSAIISPLPEWDIWVRRIAGKGKDRDLAARTLRNWQQSGDLAGVRDDEALAGLPPDERARWQKLWASVEALLLGCPGELVRRGRDLAGRREWRKAVDSYNRAMKLGPSANGEVCFEHAAVLLLSGDDKGYRNACARMVQGADKAIRLRGYHLARTCTLAPGSVKLMELVGRAADRELKAQAATFWSLTEQGALHCRAGRLEEAVDVLHQSLRADAWPGHALLNWLWLALAHQRLGETQEARRWLDRATRWLDRFATGMPARAEQGLGLHLHNWLEAHVLRREAEALLEAPAARGN